MDEMAPPAIRAILSEDDDDHVPMFPSANSAQRHAVSGSAPSSRLHPSGMNSLRAPVEPAPSQREVPMRRQKVILEPGHSPLDWARLKTTTDLRGGVSTLLRVTPSQLKQHNRLDDAWTAIQGKVYNMTPYLKFHPGGVDQLMRIAGRDGTRLFCGVGYYSPKNKAEHGPPVTPYTTIMPHFSLYVLKGLWGPNPLKIGIMLEALGADYEVKFVEFGSSDKETGVKGADYLNLCENGRTPTLVDHKRNDFVIWESGAILDYLCSVYDSENKFHGKTPEERAIVMQWLFFQVTGHSPVQGNLYFAKMYWKTAYGEDPTQVTVNRFKNELDRVFHVYEHRLQRQASLNGEDKAFLALDRPTIADYSALGWLGMLPDVAGKLEIDMQKYGILNKYIERMRNLPEAQAATRRVASGH